MSNGQGSGGKLIPLLVGVVVGIAVGIGVANMMGDKGGEGDSRGMFHDSPSPQASPERTVQMNLQDARAMNEASDPAQNPHKDAIQMKLDELLKPEFEPADPINASIRAHNAWKFAQKMVWAAVHEEIEEIN